MKQQKHASHHVNHNLHQHIFQTDDVQEVFKGTNSMPKQEIDKMFPIENSKPAEVTDKIGSAVIDGVGEAISAIAEVVDKSKKSKEKDSEK